MPDTPLTSINEYGASANSIFDSIRRSIENGTFVLDDEQRQLFAATNYGYNFRTMIHQLLLAMVEASSAEIFLSGVFSCGFCFLSLPYKDHFVTLAGDAYASQRITGSTFLQINSASYDPVDTQYEFGQTSLHHFAYLGDLASVEVLLDAGASINVRNRAGMTPLDLAISSQNMPVIECLLAFGVSEVSITGCVSQASNLPLNHRSLSQWQGDDVLIDLIDSFSSFESCLLSPASFRALELRLSDFLQFGGFGLAIEYAVNARLWGFIRFVFERHDFSENQLQQCFNHMISCYLTPGCDRLSRLSLCHFIFKLCHRDYQFQGHCFTDLYREISSSSARANFRRLFRVVFHSLAETNKRLAFIQGVSREARAQVFSVIRKYFPRDSLIDRAGELTPDGLLALGKIRPFRSCPVFGPSFMAGEISGNSTSFLLSSLRCSGAGVTLSVSSGLSPRLDAPRFSLVAPSVRECCGDSYIPLSHLVAKKSSPPLPGYLPVSPPRVENPSDVGPSTTIISLAPDCVTPFGESSHSVHASDIASALMSLGNPYMRLGLFSADLLRRTSRVYSAMPVFDGHNDSAGAAPTLGSSLGSRRASEVVMTDRAGTRARLSGR